MRSITALFVTLGSAAILHPGLRVKPIYQQPSQVVYQAASAPATLQRTISQSADSLAIYAGDYEISPDARLTVSIADGKLFILPPGETTKAELKQLSETEFDVVGEAAKLTFQKNQEGKVTQVALRFGNGASVTAKKIA